MTQLTPSLNTANPFQSQLDQIMRGIPRASQFGTTLALTRNQKRAERATVTELKRNTRLFQQSGPSGHRHTGQPQRTRGEGRPAGGL